MAAPSLLMVVCPRLEKIINLLLLVFQANPFLSLYSLLSRDYGLELRCKDFSATPCVLQIYAKGFDMNWIIKSYSCPIRRPRGKGKEMYSTRWWIYHSACCNCLYCGVSCRCGGHNHWLFVHQLFQLNYHALVAKWDDDPRIAHQNNFIEMI